MQSEGVLKGSVRNASAAHQQRDGSPASLWTASVERPLPVSPGIGGLLSPSGGTGTTDGAKASFKGSFSKSKRDSRQLVRQANAAEPDRGLPGAGTDRQSSIRLLDPTTLRFRSAHLEGKYQQSTAWIRKGRFAIDCAGHLVFILCFFLGDLLWTDPQNYAQPLWSAISMGVLFSVKGVMLVLVKTSSVPLVSFSDRNWSRVLRVLNLSCNGLAVVCT